MTLRWMYDASMPPKNPPHWHVVGGYIGGDTPHVWTRAEWNAQWALSRLPIFAASNREDTYSAANVDSVAIHRQLAHLLVPDGVTVCVDTETRVYDVYLRALNNLVRPFHLLNYGSLSYVRKNPLTSAGRWAADWTDDIFAGVDLLNQDHFTAVQWASADQRHLSYDSSIITESIPLWHR